MQVPVAVPCKEMGSPSLLRPSPPRSTASARAVGTAEVQGGRIGCPPGRRVVRAGNHSQAEARGLLLGADRAQDRRAAALPWRCVLGYVWGVQGHCVSREVDPLWLRSVSVVVLPAGDSLAPEQPYQLSSCPLCVLSVMSGSCK